jgi:hypothetical protein
LGPVQSTWNAAPASTVAGPLTSAGPVAAELAAGLALALGLGSAEGGVVGAAVGAGVGATEAEADAEADGVAEAGAAEVDGAWSTACDGVDPVHAATMNTIDAMTAASPPERPLNPDLIPDSPSSGRSGDVGDVRVMEPRPDVDAASVRRPFGALGLSGQAGVGTTDRRPPWSA